MYSLFKLTSLFAGALVVSSVVLYSAQEAPRTWSDEGFSPVTRARVAALPESERAEWLAYLKRSEAFAALLPKQEKPESSPLKPLNTPPAGGAHSRGLKLKAPKEWYASTEAQAVADRIVANQSATGGWRKGVDYTRKEPQQTKPDVWSGGTLDNDATTWELRVLALTAAANESAAAQVWKQSFLRGVDYLLASQYPNGGFPQIYPLVGGYHDAITYNDSAMSQALELLRDVAAAKSEFAFVPGEVRQRCSLGVAKGIECILKSQLRDSQGKPTAWGQQHDALTLKPCAARNFEPISLCTNESSSLVVFLMSIPKPSADSVAAVSGAVSWFEKTALSGVAWSTAQGAHHLVKSSSGTPLWARLYELDTDKPIFGDRDRTIHYSVEEISAERREGYAWYGSWPAPVIAKYRKWPARKA